MVNYKIKWIYKIMLNYKFKWIYKIMWNYGNIKL